MAYEPSFHIGDIVSNSELRKEFKVGNMGGMRKSNTLNCLVIISDYTKGLYEDKWYGEELHYTGMGKVGDQILEGNQNKTLYDSDTNGVEVHLFEVFEKGKYTYCGIVKLAGAPYREEQIDDDGNKRQVWMFPVRPLAETRAVTKEKLAIARKKRQKQTEEISTDRLQIIAAMNASRRPGIRKVVNTEIIRNPYIAEYAKRRAKGICQLCGEFAPFKDKNGKPYLESHHIEWLSKGGEDSIENTVALCPNCHRKMHLINDLSDKEKLQRKATEK